MSVFKLLDACISSSFLPQSAKAFFMLHLTPRMPCQFYLDIALFFYRLSGWRRLNAEKQNVKRKKILCHIRERKNHRWTVQTCDKKLKRRENAKLWYPAWVANFKTSKKCLRSLRILYTNPRAERRRRSLREATYYARMIWDVMWFVWLSFK